MVIAEGLLTIIIRTTMAGPATTLVIVRLKQVQNSMSNPEIQGDPGKVGIYQQ